MVKRRNYDSPFEREELENLERETILESEQLSNTEYYDEFYEYPPNGSLLNLPSSIWLSAFKSPFSSDNNEDAYNEFKKIEGLK